MTVTESEVIRMFNKLESIKASPKNWGYPSKWSGKYSSVPESIGRNTPIGLKR